MSKDNTGKGKKQQERVEQMERPGTSEIEINPDLINVTQQNVDVVQQWPVAWTNPGSNANMKSVLSLATDYLSDIPGFAEVFDVSDNAIDIKNVEIRVDDKPNPLFAYAVYVTSEFYKTKSKNVSTSMRFNLRVGNSSIPVYKRTAQSSLNTKEFTTHDAETTATAIINAAVKRQINNNTDLKYLMTAKSRVLVADDGIDKIVQLYDEWNMDTRSSPLNTAANVVSMLNAGVCNKAQQFRDIPYFDRNLGISCIIGGIMLAKKNATQSKEIGLTKMSKLARIPKGMEVDVVKIVEILRCFNLSSKFSEESLRDIMDAVTSTRRAGAGSMFAQSNITGMTPSYGQQRITSGNVPKLSIS